MDSNLHKNITDRDAALSRTGRVTRGFAALSASRSLVLMAGFAHIITPDSSRSSRSRSGTTGVTGNGNSNGASRTPTPTHGSGPSHATSGGS